LGVLTCSGFNPSRFQTACFGAKRAVYIEVWNIYDRAPN
jgi:hypothetical protein